MKQFSNIVLTHRLIFNTGAQKVAKTVSEDVIVQRVNAEAGSVRALPLAENAIQMFAGIAGLGSPVQIQVFVIYKPKSSV